MLFVNVLCSNILLISITLVFSCLIGAIAYFNKKYNFINDKSLNIISIVLLVLGIIIHLYFILGYKYHLFSDYELYFNTASNLFDNRSLLETEYLSYNRYVVIYSSILGIIFKIFGSSIVVAQLFNLVTQLLTVYFMYLILKDSGSKYKYLIPAIWFVLPVSIFVNVLVSTECLFMLLFTIAIYMFYKLSNSKKSGVWQYILFGVLLGLSNNIRPVMMAFIGAMILYYIFANKRLINYLLLSVSLIVFIIVNLGCTIYADTMIGEKHRDGSSQWALYFGANYNTRGGWSEADSYRAFEILDKENGVSLLNQETINRYKDMGILKTMNHFRHKYELLWADVDTMYNSANFLSGNKYSSVINKINYYVSYVSLVLILICVTISVFNRADYSYVLIFFGIIYIVSNLLVVVNGRYNYPMYLVLLLIIGFASSKVVDRNI